MKPIALRLALAQGASGLIAGAATPFFGAWLAWKGLSPATIGALFAAGMFLRVIVAPLTGLAADARNDRRATMLLLGVVILTGYALLNVVARPDMILLAGIPVIVALGAINPLLESVCVRLASRFAFDYGHVRLWASTAFVFGNVLSGFLISRFGLIIVSWWLVVAAALNLLALYALPPPLPEHAPGPLLPRVRDTLAQARELLSSRVFLLFLAAAALDQGSHAFYYGYGSIHWQQLGYSGWLIGLIWPLGVLTEIALLSVSLRLFRRVGAPRLLLLGGVCCVLRWTVLAFDPPLPLVILAQTLHGGTFALAHLGAMYFVQQAVPARLAATAQSLYAVCWSGFAIGLATLASGRLYGAYGGHTYLLMAAMGLASIVFALRLAGAWRGEPVVADSFDADLAMV